MIPSHLFPTTTVGSFPKPPQLQLARRKHRRGQLDREALRDLERQATREWIRRQEELGLDVLVDGEQYRADMVTFFAEELDGFRIAGMVRAFGNRYYRKPVVVGPVGRRRPLLVEWFRFAQSLTSKPVKAVLTGPYTLAEWSFNEYYPQRRELVLDLARVLREEVRDLVHAGARYIQIDEPAIHSRPEEDFELAREALTVITDGLEAYTIVHICYGDVAKIYPSMLRLPVDQIDLAFANTRYALLEVFRMYPFTRDVGLGVIDVLQRRVETVEEVVSGIQRALEVFTPRQVFISPDCGLRTCTMDVAVMKLQAMVEAARFVRTMIP
ncbi:MAG: methionine synthase [Armatimonadota bacterium]|nr:methionine synthase [Armatimonadota bacterium]MDR7438281.1 methionine synthase [Armatimonadota bacterium]MDR7443397.1 methionine synthase [Armatimonadota bacterium]MDR7563398.1 methionine synthase [Armatimonadota bacterium]MDR7567683.1 methionine synthase [Armatimonadota bacterium]